MSRLDNTPIKLKAVATALALSVSATGVPTTMLNTCASEQINFEDLTTELEITGLEDATYTGREIKQDLTVKYKGETLRENTDYECLYAGNIHAGTASIMIRGIGDYEGTKTVYFTINKANPDCSIEEQIVGTFGDCLGDIALPKRGDGEYQWVEEESVTPNQVGEFNYHLKFTPYDTDNYNVVENMTVTILIQPKNLSDQNVEILGIEDAVYCQTAITPEPVIKIGDATSTENGDASQTQTETTPSVPGTTVLVKDRDYTVSYDNNTNAGTAICMIVGIGNYKGTVQKTFTIKKADPDYGTVDTLQAVYRDCLGDIILPSRDNGTFVWEYNQSMSVGVVGLNSSYALRFVPTDKANYNIMKDIPVNIQVSKKDISLVAFPEMKAQTYTGKELFQNIYLKDGEIKLVKDKDYVVTYKDNINVGTASVVIKGVDNYNGEKILQFPIEKAVPKYTKPGTLSATYGETLAEVKLPQCDNGAFYFEQDLDTGVGDAGINGFTLKFVPSDEENYVVVEGIPVNIKVAPLDLSDAKVTGVEKNYPATGKEVRPEIKVIHNGKELEKDKDFSVGYANNIYPGKAAVVVKGCENYAGKIITFYQVE